MKNNEIWKDIVGYEGLYLVSNYGNVKKYDGKILKQYNRGYYLAVTLIKDKAETIENVHRLVGKAFVDNPNDLPMINHKDENKMNNNADNLEWCDCQYNLSYGTRLEKVMTKLRKPILQLDDGGNVVAEYIGINETKQYGFTPQAISECCRGKRERHKGYMWRFKYD